MSLLEDIGMEFSRRKMFVGVTLFWMIGLMGSAVASDPSYEPLYSDRFTVLTGFELSETGVKAALAHGKNWRLDTLSQVLSVIGEQRYVNLLDDLKALCYPSPEEPVNVNKHAYGGTVYMDYLRSHAARALILCGAEDGIQYAIEQVMRSPEMGMAEALYSVRNLKYIVQEFGTDLLSEFKFLIQDLPDSRMISENAFSELVQVEAYCRLSGNFSDADAYHRLLDECIEDAPLDLKRWLQRLVWARPVWSKCTERFGDLSLQERTVLQFLSSQQTSKMTFVDTLLNLRRVRSRMTDGEYNDYLLSGYRDASQP